MSTRRRHRNCSIYDGQQPIGRIEFEADDCVITFDCEGKRIGVFGDQASASFAIGAAARARSSDADG
jgi:hypothetical protein